MDGLRGFMNRVNMAGPDDSEELEYDDESYEGYDVSSSAVVPMHVTEPAADLSRIVTVRPRKYADSEMLALPDSLKAGIPVIAHIGNMGDSDQKAFMYFMSGVAYSLDAHTEHVAPHVFLVSPREVSVVDSEGRILSEGD